MADIPCLPSLEFSFNISLSLPAFPPKISLPKLKVKFELPCPLELAGGAPIVTVTVG